MGLCEIEHSEMEVKTKSRREERTEGGTLQIATRYVFVKVFSFFSSVTHGTRQEKNGYLVRLGLNKNTLLR